MSIGVYGSVELCNQYFDLQEHVEISFLIIEAGTKNRMGIKAGGNIGEKYLKKIRSLKNAIYFELTDTPLDNNAETLFNGDGVQVFENGLRIDMGESLRERMSRVLNFVNDLLMSQLIDNVTLDININNGDEFDTVIIKQNEFLDFILDRYKQEENWTPCIRIVLTREDRSQ